MKRSSWLSSQYSVRRWDTEKPNVKCPRLWSKLSGRKEGKLNLSDGWWFRFTRRWPTYRKGDGFSQARADNTNRDVFVSYFELLKATLIENDLLDKPAQIYNCDESGLPLDHKMPRVIAKRGAKKVRLRTSGREQDTDFDLGLWQCC